VRVLEVGHDPCLAKEAGDEGRVGGEARMDHLHGNGAADGGIGRAIDLRDAALTEEDLEPVSAKGGADERMNHAILAGVCAATRLSARSRRLSSETRQVSYDLARHLHTGHPVRRGRQRRCSRPLTPLISAATFFVSFVSFVPRRSEWRLGLAIW
jgi:hypothetical protein